MTTSVEPSSATERPSSVVRITPPSSWPGVNWSELIGNRELLWFLTWRDVQVRYKQTALGAAWAILQPLMAMAVFTVVLRRLAGVESDGIPYPLFAYAGLVAWTFHSTAVTQAANSLIMNERIIAKVYFPRLLIPVAAVGAVLVDFALAAIVLGVIMAIYGVAPGAEIVLLPLYLLVLFATTAGTGILLGAVNVRYRDVRYLLPFGMQMWLFASPIAYSTSLVPEAWQPVVAINPLVLAVEGMRHALLGTPAPSTAVTITGAIGATLFLVVGVKVFRRFETTFADDV
ncbi:MAG: ABC transporter permease [Actinomycetota bacterium]